MLYDLILNSNAGANLGLAKIDVVKEGGQLSGKMVNVNDFTFVAYPSGDANKAAKELLQKKITDSILEKEHVFGNLLAEFTKIGVLAVLDGVTLNPVPTTTTTTAG